MDKQTDDPITGCPWMTFQGGGGHKNTQEQDCLQHQMLTYENTNVK